MIESYRPSPDAIKTARAWKAIEKRKAMPSLSRKEVEVLIEQVGGPSMLDLEFRRFLSCDLEGIDLKGARLSGANFTQANLGDANLEGAVLIGAQFPGVDLEKANLQYADLSYVNFSFDSNNYSRYKKNKKHDKSHFHTSLRFADLRRANFEGALMFGVDLEGANLRHASLENAKMGKLVGGGYSATGPDTVYTNLKDTYVTRGQLLKVEKYSGIILPNGKFFMGDGPRSI